MSTAAVHGPRWGARAEGWAKLAAPLSRPAWEAVAAATGIAAGTAVLDVGCGSGEFCRLAADRLASVSGIDAAEGMIAIARPLVPEADLRVGAIEQLPWDDGRFDVVTGFNAFQFAADVAAALAEARRVARRGGRVVVCTWSRPQDSDMFAIMGALRPLQPPAPEARPEPPALHEPDVLDDLAARAGLRPAEAWEVDVPFAAPDRETLERALLTPGSVGPAVEYSGEARVRAAIAAAAVPFERGDGSYRLENRFRCVIANA